MTVGSSHPERGERGVVARPWPFLVAVSVAISLFLLWLIYLKTVPSSAPLWSSRLPAVNALCNALSACCLVGGYLSIRRQRRELHMRFMLAAVGCSLLFLASYVTYHHFHGDTTFTGQGWLRPVYFFILISHIVLSVVVLPMVLTTLWHAARRRFDAHRRIARFTFPLWLYVSVTGVLVFLLLRAYG